MLIGRRYLYDGHIYRHIITEQVGDIAQKNRNKIGAALIYRLANRLRNEHTVDMKVVFIFSFVNFNITFDRDKNQFNIAQAIFLSSQRMHEIRRRLRTTLYKYTVTRLDHRKGFFRGYIFYIGRHSENFYEIII